MRPLAPYLLFFLSGAAGLVYQVTWVRSLSLVFGGSHLAVTTVLAVYMGGQALGAALFGRRADRTGRPLRLYALLELGIAAFALAFIALMAVYPTLYVPLARLGEENRPYLSVLRVAFAAAAMIVPTTLMGGTLPVLSRFVARRGRGLGRQLAFLYGFNTLGAVAGSLAAGFVLLRGLGVTGTLLFAGAVNLAVGLAAALLREDPLAAPEGPADRGPGAAAAPSGARPVSARSARLVLWGAGVSGFCALGYEVLWTRMLTLVVGTSVYGFTVMLVAFLSGIALGSQVYGLVRRRREEAGGVVAFGLVQVAIGATALVVTVLMRDLPAHATRLQGLLVAGAAEFGARQGASFAVAFAYMLVPAFFMGVAFPLAGAVLARAGGAAGGAVGGAVGRIVTVNTAGAILGSIASGFVLVYVFGIERSLQLLVVVNVGFGAVVAASALRWRAAPWGAAAAAAAAAVALAAFPGWGRSWDQKYFAVFRNNQRSVFASHDRIEEALENTDVLYYFEGVNETISVIRPKGAMQAFIVNGRPEASNSPIDMQCQRTLGHAPMLLHPNPKKVFVLGTGTAMTLGATALHPEVERIVLAEIEPGVLGAARTFAEYNHGVLDDPRLHVVFNDGRNYLATTREKFDVITADPIHPWSGGAAYLYTTEYFRSVADHLRPGGIATQWLPIYELSTRDLQTVVRTFADNFAHVAIWLTHYDAELVGSDAPLTLDEAALARRMANPAIQRDLAAVEMGSAQDFLAYFLAGDAGTRAFARGGLLNTDDNLTLEFSAPESMGVFRLTGDNAAALARVRESPLPYLAPAATPEARAEQERRWAGWMEAAAVYDRAHVLSLLGEHDGGEFRALMAALEARFPDYAPYRFLRGHDRGWRDAEPRLADSASFPVVDARGQRRTLQVSAVTLKVGPTRGLVVLVDNERRDVYGQRYFDGDAGSIDGTIARFAAETLGALRESYAELAGETRRVGFPVPPEELAVPRLKGRVAAAVAQ